DPFAPRVRRSHEVGNELRIKHALDERRWVAGVFVAPPDAETFGRLFRNREVDVVGAGIVRAFLENAVVKLVVGEQVARLVDRPQAHVRVAGKKRDAAGLGGAELPAQRGRAPLQHGPAAPKDQWNYLVGRGIGLPTGRVVGQRPHVLFGREKAHAASTSGSEFPDNGITLEWVIGASWIR